MSQICYNIVDLLRNQRLHVRAIGKVLNINQMTILRRIKDLQDENIIDSEYEGKNLVCFLKDSIEAKEYLYIIEHNKLINILNEYPRLRIIIKNIKENKNIKLALIFGSFAKNLELNTSDIDLYLETNDKKLKNQFELIDSKLNIKIGIFDKNSNLGKEIIKDHIIIKGVEYFYEIH